MWEAITSLEWNLVWNPELFSKRARSEILSKEFSEIFKAAINSYVHSIFKLLLIKQVFEKLSHWGQRPKAGCKFGLELPLAILQITLSCVINLKHLFTLKTTFTCRKNKHPKLQMNTVVNTVKMLWKEVHRTSHIFSNFSKNSIQL